MKHGFVVLFLLVAGCGSPQVSRLLPSEHPQDGQGSALLPDGSRYEGRFRHGLFHGEGVLTSRHGRRYEGSFKNGKLEGSGRIEYPDGARYVGEWADWTMNGHGVFTDPDEWVYRGSFLDGKPTGDHEIDYPDGARYRGGMQGWSYQGVGLYTDDEGTRYEGMFVEGALSGEGTITWSNGNRYEGEIDDWDPEGQGRWVDSDGNRYEGEFRYGRYEGQGRLTRADGSVYEGAFDSGRFHGLGTLTWLENGEPQSLTGPFRRGYYVGPGRHDYLSDGRAAPDGEQLQFRQRELLDDALASVAAERPTATDFFLLTFAGHGRQAVFRKEATFGRNRLQAKFVEAEHSLALVNHVDSVDDAPLATRTNLRYALAALGRRMNVEDDVLILFLTSHGSSDHELSVNLPGLTMAPLPASELALMLDDSGIRWRIVVVSACYSGGFIEALKNDHSLIMTSSRADRTSFGCTDDADLTYFGKAFFEQALPVSSSLEDAFFRSRKLVSARELAAGYTPSEPQIHVGRRIAEKLATQSERLATTTEDTE